MGDKGAVPPACDMGQHLQRPLHEELRNLNIPGWNSHPCDGTYPLSLLCPGLSLGPPKPRDRATLDLPGAAQQLWPHLQGKS